MKSLIFIFICIISVNIYSQNQLVKGVYTVGGNISFSSYSVDESSSNQKDFVLYPNVGYFFIDNLYTGVTLLYSHFSSDDYASSTYGIGPAVRYYFAFDKLRPFLGVNYLYEYNNNNQGDDTLIQTDLTMSGGISYFITNYFAIETSMNYSFINRHFKSSGNSEYHNAKQFDITVGAKYFIN